MNTYIFRHVVVASAISAVSVACTNTSSNFLDTNPVFHSAVLEPVEITGAPAILIGIEKASRKIVGRTTYKNCSAGVRYCFDTNSDYVVEDRNTSSSLKWDIGKRFREFKPTFISHVVGYQPNDDGTTIRRMIYNVYEDPTALQGRKSLIDKSWDVLVEDVSATLEQTVRENKTTHIVIMSTGWNTPQKESIDNYNSWISTLGAEATARNVKYQPLYIGFSWPSDWTKLPGPSDLVNKAHDADEIGLTWANVLANLVIPQVVADSNLKVVYIGHSFGARLLTRALHSYPLISQDTPNSNRLFIGLQGALSLSRFFENAGEEGSPYWDYPNAAKKFIFTTSRHDTAMDMAPALLTSGTPYVGDDTVYSFTTDSSYRHSGQIEHARLKSDGGYSAEPSWSNSALLAFVNADSVIDTQKEGTGGGAHSDVFDEEIADFLMSSIFEGFEN